MSQNRSLSRRRFLRHSAVTAAGAVAAPYFVPSSALGLAGTTAPSNRITLGLVGCGEHGVNWNLPQIFRNPDSQVIAVCDVDEIRCRSAKARVDEQYARALGRVRYKGCTAYGDFRELINRKDIDALVNCTPDHWHVIPAIMAAKAGKDVICEKPLTLTVAEGRILCDVIRQTGRIFQTASENRSIDSYIRMCELVRNGRIGALKHIRVSLPGGNDSRGDNFALRQVQPVPATFNYDMWLGQAPVAPYCPARCHGSFRWNLDYSGGRLTDWGAHMIDLAQWGNDTEGTGPIEVEGKGDFPPRDALFNTAQSFDLHYRYANGVTMTVVSSGPGIRFEGTEGWIGFEGWRGPLQASTPAILDSKIGPNEVQLYRPSEIIPRTAGDRGGEHRNFIDCVKSRKPCYAPAEVGHRTITIAHIGNIAMLLGRKLRWDPKAERFVGDAEADADVMLRRKQREPWAIGNIDSWLKKNA
jgi:predicted dehydrogenase